MIILKYPYVSICDFQNIHTLIVTQSNTIEFLSQWTTSMDSHVIHYTIRSVTFLQANFLNTVIAAVKCGSSDSVFTVLIALISVDRI